MCRTARLRLFELLPRHPCDRRLRDEAPRDHEADGRQGGRAARPCGCSRRVARQEEGSLVRVPRLPGPPEGGRRACRLGGVGKGNVEVPLAPIAEHARAKGVSPSTVRFAHRDTVGRLCVKFPSRSPLSCWLAALHDALPSTLARPRCDRRLTLRPPPQPRSPPSLSAARISASAAGGSTTRSRRPFVAWLSMGGPSPFVRSGGPSGALAWSISTRPTFSSRVPRHPHSRSR